jgi:hypothetical protein
MSRKFPYKKASGLSSPSQKDDTYIAAIKKGRAQADVLLDREALSVLRSRLAEKTTQFKELKLDLSEKVREAVNTETEYSSALTEYEYYKTIYLNRLQDYISAYYIQINIGSSFQENENHREKHLLQLTKAHDDNDYILDSEHKRLIDAHLNQTEKSQFADKIIQRFLKTSDEIQNSDQEFNCDHLQSESEEAFKVLTESKSIMDTSRQNAETLNVQLNVILDTIQQLEIDIETETTDISEIKDEICTVRSNLQLSVIEIKKADENAMKNNILWSKVYTLPDQLSPVGSQYVEQEVTKVGKHRGSVEKCLESLYGDF